MTIKSSSNSPGTGLLGKIRYIQIPSLMILFFFFCAAAFAGGSMYWIFKKDNEIEKFRRMELDLQNQIRERDQVIRDEKQKIEQLQRRVQIFNAIEELSQANSTDDEKWKIAKLVDEESDKYNHDPLLIVAMMYTESSITPDAKSDKGARGLMQLMPDTGHALSKEITLNPKLLGMDKPEETKDQNFKNIEGNIRLGTLYLTKLLMKYRNMEDAFCAYNIGPSRFEQLKKEGKKASTRYASKILTTYNYLKKSRDNHTENLPKVFAPEETAPLIAKITNN